MRTNWIITVSSAEHAFVSAKDAAAFIRANGGRGVYFELDAPTTLSVEDRKYFEGMLIEATFGQK